jgi:hypothetical protein
MKPLVMVASLFCMTLTASLPSMAQVGEIKSASSGSSRGAGGDRSGSGGSDIYVDVVFQSFGLFVTWQEETLRKKAENANIVSLDFYLQTAFQPSSYYIIHPRIRGNWGLFSTDFRVNYLLEETFDGVEYLRTDDWQVLQLNVLTLNNVTFRIGGGILHENFSGGKTFPEWTTAFQLQNNGHRLGGVAEYRWSLPRKEVSAHLQFKLWGTNHFHTYATVGALYQQYYSAISVWGIQTGLMFRIN